MCNKMTGSENNISFGIGLMLSVHFYALRTEPRAYFTAWWWWLCRKRLRARYQFAPLLARAPNAYSLWLREKKQHIATPCPPEAGRDIIAIVENGLECDLTATIDSLVDEAISVLILGSPNLPTSAEIAQHVELETKPWLMPLRAGDVLARGAGDSYRAAIAEHAANDAGPRVIYADDDLVDQWGHRQAPHFKPDWNAELFQHFDYVAGSCIVQADKVELSAVASLPCWAAELVSTVAEQTGARHLPQILHHRKHRPTLRSLTPPHTVKSQWPMVSIIIPTRNRVDLLKTCLHGIDRTDYPNFEVIIVDNDSDDSDTLSFLSNLDSKRYRVLHHPGTFNFSAINNQAARTAKGQLLCLLNNDAEVLHSDWLKIMVTQAERQDVGAVGARLLYPDGRIQHAGVVIGMGNAAGHAHRFLKPDEEGYFHRHSLPQFTSAVTAACLVVATDRFWAVDGLDEKYFAVAFNDVDLCMRLNQRGWQSLYEPRATLIHHESISRGFDRDPIGSARLEREIAALKKRWHTDILVDPFHHKELSRASEQFVIQL